MRDGVALAVLLTFLAGCASPIGDVAADVDPTVGADWPERAVAGGVGHDHRDPAAHLGRSTPNFALVGRAELTAGGYGCGGAATRADGRTLVVAQSRSDETSLSIVDVTDPANPFTASEVQLVGAKSYDATLTPDGRHVLVGTYPPGGFASEPTAAAPVVHVVARNACGAQRILPAGIAPGLFPGVLVFSLEDPASATFEAFQPLPVSGAHSLSVVADASGTLVLAGVTNVENAASYFQIYRLVEAIGVAQLEPLALIPAQDPTVGPTGGNGHADGEMRRHPVTGALLAYLAADDLGLQIYDITDPRAPRHLATWSDDVTAFAPGAVHSVLPVDALWDGRHVTFVAQEVLNKPFDRGSGWVYALDTTDPAAPVELARWSLPDMDRWLALQFTTHYLALVERTLFVAAFHGGVWAIDASDPADLGAVGVFVPESMVAPPIAWSSGSPSVIDLFALPAGDLAVLEAGSGLHVVRFDAASPAPRR